MGIYVNPNQMSKESFLEKCGEQIEWPDSLGLAVRGQNEDKVLVVLIDNGPFSAAAVAYDEDEFDSLTRPSDVRYKTFWLVPKKRIVGVIAISDYKWLAEKGILPAEI